ncbi:hypothetical protein QBC40DRAFT_249492 [Triangularia verruculosa]|uniref:Uncharacterized protein n=1 Tax=Triangularia verruculosa TaxID=2587418 RepID=A0AAN6XTA3_9PEZI|nr:hypothetical protein QBC40DRAFT_249492 [Triangularia verruculosa]
MRSQAMSTGLLALAIGVAGVSSAESIDWSKYKDEGNTVCPQQVETCRAYCSYRGGTFSAELSNSCWSNNEGYDNPFQSITYCYMCRCANDPKAEPDLSLFYGSVQRYVCERRKQNCQYSYNQYAQMAPEGQCECPAAQSISVTPGARVGKMTSLPVATGTLAVDGKETVTLTSLEPEGLTTATTAPVPTATRDRSGSWDSLDSEEKDHNRGDGLESPSTEEQFVQLTSAAEPVPASTSETIVDSRAMRQAVGMVGVILAVMMAI